MIQITNFVNEIDTPAYSATFFCTYCVGFSRQASPGINSAMMGISASTKTEIWFLKAATYVQNGKDYVHLLSHPSGDPTQVETITG